MNEAWLLLDRRKERLKMAFCYGSSHDVILNVTKIRNLYKINVMLFVQWWNIKEVVLYIRRRKYKSSTYHTLKQNNLSYVFWLTYIFYYFNSTWAHGL